MIRRTTLILCALFLCVDSRGDLECVVAFKRFLGQGPADTEGKRLIAAYQSFLDPHLESAPLTIAELRALKENPFEFPEMEPGRASRKQLARLLNVAFERVSDPHKPAIRAALEASISHALGESAWGQREKAADHAEAASSAIPFARPIFSGKHPSHLGSMKLLPDASGVLLDSGNVELFSQPFADWRRSPHGDMGNKAVAHTDGEWMLRYEAGENHRVKASWVPIRTVIPKSPMPSSPATVETILNPSRIEFSADGKSFLLVSHHSDVAKVYRLNSGTAADEIHNVKQVKAGLVRGFSRDGTRVWATSWSNGVASIIEIPVDPKKKKRAFDVPLVNVGSVVESKDGKTLFVLNEWFTETKVVEIDIASGKETRSFPVRLAEHAQYVFSPDARWLLASELSPGFDSPNHSHAVHAHLYSLADGKRNAVGIWAKPVESVSFSQDGNDVLFSGPEQNSMERRFAGPDWVEVYRIEDWIKVGRAGQHRKVAK